MQRLRSRITLLVFIALFSALSVPAHHGNAIYDTKSTLVLTGSVTQLTLANPHSWVAFDVKDDKGEVEHWTVEFGILKELVAQGWTDTTLKPGDQVKVQLHPKRDGAHGGLLVKEIAYADGRSLSLNPPPAPHPYRAVHW